MKMFARRKEEKGWTLKSWKVPERGNTGRIPSVCHLNIKDCFAFFLLFANNDNLWNKYNKFVSNKLFVLQNSSTWHREVFRGIYQFC